MLSALWNRLKQIPGLLAKAREALLSWPEIKSHIPTWKQIKAKPPTWAEIKAALPSHADLRTMSRPWLIFVIACMISGLVLGGVHELLKDRIAANSLVDPTSLSRAFPVADDFQRISNPPDFSAGTCYAAYAGNERVGYVISVTEKGRNGNIQVLVGVDLNGAIVGTFVDPSKHKETQDIGGDAIESAAFQNQFIGGSTTFIAGENVDAVTYATISSTAVIRAVNRGLEVAQMLIEHTP